MIVVVSNLSTTESAEGRIRLPNELAELVSLPSKVKVAAVLAEPGGRRSSVRTNAATLVGQGFRVSLKAGGCRAFVIE
jgi:hypothetical protein